MIMPNKLKPYTPQDDMEYLVARLEWRAKLSDVDCRSMAYEYRVALSAYEKHGGSPPSEDLIDANDEYAQRFGGTPHSEFLKKPKMFKGRRKDRPQSGSLSPLYNERGELI